MLFRICFKMRTGDHLEDEDEAYERWAQYETDLRTEQLAMAKAKRATRRGGLAAGLVRHFASVYKNLQSRTQ